MIPLLVSAKRLALTALVIGLTFTVLAPIQAHAATQSAADSIADQTEQWLRFRGIYGCVAERGLAMESPSDVYAGKFFSNGATAIGYLNPDGKVSCNDAAFVDNSLGIIGFKDNAYAYCAAQPSSYRVDGQSTKDTDGCVNGKGFFNNGESSETTTAKQWFAGLKKQIPNYANFVTASGGQYDQSKYYMYSQSLVTFCGAKQGGEYTGSNEQKATVGGDKRKVLVDVVDGEGKIQTYIYTLDRDKTDTVNDIYNNMGSDSDDYTCAAMAKRTQDLAKATGAYVARYNQLNPNAPRTDIAKNGESTSDNSETSCAVEGIGWIICPVAITIAKFNDSLFTILEKLLGINAKILFDTGGPTYKSWESMRNLANVAFIVAFMVIIYSQLTGAGVSNYGIKKLLPRIVVAAILVNISFWICALGVDASNIIGSSLHSLLIEQVNNTGAGSGTNWNDLTSWLLAGGSSSLAIGGAALAIGSYGFLGALALLIPLVVAALVAALTVVFVLIARQAFVIILIVLSPLAFVAYLLPNTESWFDKWRKAFISLLLIYPMVALLFGGAQLASAVIRNGATDVLVYILSLVVLVVPLFITPILLRFSGGLISRVAGMINNPNRGPFDRMKKAGAAYSERKRGFKMGDNIERTNKLRKRASDLRSDTSGGRFRRFGRSAGATALGGVTWVSGIGNTNAKDSEEKNKYAKASSEAAQRNYVAKRAISDTDYAERLAGGNEELGSLVKAYSIEAVEHERKKDRDAQKTILVHDNVDFKTLSQDIKSGTYTSNQAKEEAALERYFELANSDGVQDMINHIGDSALATDSSGAVTEKSKERAEELRKIAANSLSGHPLKPVDLSASNLTKLKNGDAIDSEARRIASTVGDGKTTSSHIAKMDIDEMRRWNAQMDANADLFINSSAEVIRATREAVEQAESDPRLNVNFGDREKKALQEMKARLQAAEASATTRKQAQNAAASTYGPTI